MSLRAEIPHRGPDEQDGEHDEPTRDVCHVETSDREVERTVSVRRDRKGLREPFENLYDDEDRSEQKAESEPEHGADAFASLDAALGPPHAYAAREQHECVRQREAQSR